LPRQFSFVVLLNRLKLITGEKFIAMKKYRLKEDAAALYVLPEKGIAYDADYKHKNLNHSIAELVSMYPDDWEEVPEEKPNHTVLGAEPKQPVFYKCHIGDENLTEGDIYHENYIMPFGLTVGKLAESMEGYGFTKMKSNYFDTSDGSVTIHLPQTTGVLDNVTIPPVEPFYKTRKDYVESKVKDNEPINQIFGRGTRTFKVVTTPEQSAINLLKSLGYSITKTY